MGFKLHSPTFHMGGRKYRPSQTLAGLYVGVNSKGKLRGHWRSGWREHHSEDVSSVSNGYRLRSIRALVRPQTSARSLAVSGNYKNPLRSTVYG